MHVDSKCILKSLFDPRPRGIPATSPSLGTHPPFASTRSWTPTGPRRVGYAWLRLSRAGTSAVGRLRA